MVWGHSRSVTLAGILLLRLGEGGVEKLRLKLTSTKVEVELEAELGKG